LAGSPSTAQARGDRILLYVRGRPVSDKLLAGAVKNAYQGRLVSREQPQALIFVNLDPAEVDVNVHPAKLEVRFRREDAVFSAVRTAIVRALDTRQAVQSGGEPAPEPRGVLRSPEKPAFQPYQQLLDAGAHAPPPEQGSSTGAFPEPSDTWDADAASPEPPSPPPSPSGDAESSAPPRPYWERSPAESGPPRPPALHDQQTAYNGEILATHGLEYLGQIADAYLALRGPRGELLLVDQHAAHERVLFEARRRTAADAPARPLAMPLTLSLHPSEAERLQQLWSGLRSLGFELEMQGAGQVLLRACPGELEAGQAQHYLRAAVGGQAESLEDLWVLMSCRAAVKAGERLGRGEALALLEAWLGSQNREHCPHGRPTIVRFEERDLARLFKRSG
jgi:DNA mismatch repair protein MutL